MPEDALQILVAASRDAMEVDADLACHLLLAASEAAGRQVSSESWR